MASNILLNKIVALKEHPLLPEFSAYVKSLPFGRPSEWNWGNMELTPEADVEEFESWLAERGRDLQNQAAADPSLAAAQLKAETSVAVDLASASAEKHGYELPAELQQHAQASSSELLGLQRSAQNRGRMDFPTGAISTTPLAQSSGEPTGLRF